MADKCWDFASCSIFASWSSIRPMWRAFKTLNKSTHQYLITYLAFCSDTPELLHFAVFFFSCPPFLLCPFLISANSAYLFWNHRCNNITVQVDCILVSSTGQYNSNELCKLHTDRGYTELCSMFFLSAINKQKVVDSKSCWQNRKEIQPSCLLVTFWKNNSYSVKKGSVFSDIHVKRDSFPCLSND